MRRLGAAAMGLAVAALGLVVSPLAAGSASAAPACDTDGVYCGAMVMASDGYHSPDVMATGGVGSAVQLTNSDIGPGHHWMFVPNPNGNGTFTVRYASNGLCLDVSGSSEAMVLSTCAGQSSQNWYAQPLTQKSTEWHPVFRIRHTNDDKCMNAWGGSTNTGTTIGLYPCQGNSWNDRVGIGKYTPSRVDPLELIQQLRSLGTMYALNQFNNRSSVIPTATFDVGTPAPVRSGPAEVVGAPYFAGSTGSTYGYGWSQSTGYTFSNGGSVTVTGTVGTSSTNLSPVAASLSVAIQGYWGSQWSTMMTQSGDVRFDIPPGQLGWVARAQLLKSMTGTWKITNDKGETWQGEGTATIPAVDGTDSPNNSSVRYQCTTNPNNLTWAEACYKTVPTGYYYPATRPA
ncbi:RICIN domain-containing protein [Streptomyces sp. NPDC048717]|uniref:RICIN domain-containing protein n=1 Tax=Streptomyces sp. NPDC048717 TaxID=3154928 RepID=UPI00343DFD0E